MEGFGPLVVGWLGDHQRFLDLDAIHLALDHGVRARWVQGAAPPTFSQTPKAATSRLWQACQEVFEVASHDALEARRLEVVADLPVRPGLPWEASWVVAVVRSLASLLPPAGPSAESLARTVLDRVGLHRQATALRAAIRAGVTHSVLRPARFDLALPILPGHVVLVATDSSAGESEPPHWNAVRETVDRLSSQTVGFEFGQAPVEELYDGLYQSGQVAPRGFWEEVHQRDLTQAGRTVLEARDPDLPRLGELVDEAHQRREELDPSPASCAALRAALREAGALCVRWAGPRPGGHLLAWTLGDAAPLAQVAADRGHAAVTCRVLPPS